MNCYECRESHKQSGVMVPCDDETRHPETERLGHWCPWGLVPPLPENTEALAAFRTVQVFGYEAGVRVLIARLGSEGFAEVAPKLEVAVGEYNSWLNRKRPNGGD